MRLVGVQPHEGNAPLVEFTLAAEGVGTRLRVTESGFTSLDKPEQDRAAYIDTHDKDWDVHMASLRNYVARQP